ncbi:hypothetical protein JW766_03250 [Candidatus Dojkabacteria bacterium]|nr:hypothetical protein [Candidatus Dojkabacteria bacterium]
MSKYIPETCDLKFTRDTVYKDLRKLGGNAFRDIKMSLSLGTTSDLVYYLKDHSKLLKGHTGDEIVEPLAQGSFSFVYLIKDHNGSEIVVKRSHDGWVPFQVGEYVYVPAPRSLVKFFFPDYDITPRSLKRDVYDYEEILKKFWGDERVKLEGEKFMPYLNMALHMVDMFLPEFTVHDIYSQKFWAKLLKKERHSKLLHLQKYLRNIETPALLIPKEERFIFYDAFSDSLQTVFIQEAMKGKEDIIPGKKMAFPFELISSGVIPKEMPKLMIEHILRAIECFVKQLERETPIPKVPDFRPLESWKIFPPTAYEIYFAETSNLVVYKGKNGRLNIGLVDTHVLHEPDGDLIYRWVERRCWISMFLNLRFWVRKALEEM